MFISFHRMCYGRIPLSSHINILHQIAKLNCSLIYCRGIKTSRSSPLEPAGFNLFTPSGDTSCQTWTCEALTSQSVVIQVQQFGGGDVNLCDLDF